MEESRKLGRRYPHGPPWILAAVACGEQTPWPGGGRRYGTPPGGRLATSGRHVRRTPVAAGRLPGCPDSGRDNRCCEHWPQANFQVPGGIPSEPQVHPEGCVTPRTMGWHPDAGRRGSYGGRRPLYRHQMGPPKLACMAGTADIAPDCCPADSAGLADYCDSDDFWNTSRAKNTVGNKRTTVISLEAPNGASTGELTSTHRKNPRTSTVIIGATVLH